MSKLYYRQRERWSECQPNYKPNTKANKEGKWYHQLTKVSNKRFQHRNSTVFPMRKYNSKPLCVWGIGSPKRVSQEEDQNVSASRDGGNQNGIKESMNAYQKNHNHHMDSAICQESRNYVEAQQPWMTVQQLIDTVQHELTAGYVTGKLN